MIALGPKALRRAAVVLGIWAVLHIADRVIAGIVQCQALGCLPNGGLL